MTALAVILGAIALIGGWLMGFYNGVITLRNKVEAAFADIDTQLKRRYDLIPNLMETVKGYMKHEKGTLEEIVKLRGQAMGAGNMKDQSQAEGLLTGALKSLFALAENYPDLKADTSFLELQENLSEVEEHINSARRYYNGTVKDFNTKIQLFPGNLVAGIFGFTNKEFFEAEEVEKENVKVEF